jgi:hypothetical protein
MVRKKIAENPHHRIDTTVTEIKCCNKNKKLNDCSTEGVAPPTYYCRRNRKRTQVNFLNENKVLQYRNTDFFLLHKHILPKIAKICTGVFNSDKSPIFENHTFVRLKKNFFKLL